MPRLIDHAARRAELAEAVWRVIVRDGVGAVSVRTVAAEAGVSAGSLRHVLPSKGLMLAAAMDLVVERATARFQAHAPVLASRADVVALLGEMLPLDEERRLEMQIHLALAAEAAGHPELSHVRAGPDGAVRSGCRTLLDLAHRDGHLRRGLDLDAETTRLHVLLDGLAFHLLGDVITVAGAHALLDEHLAARWRH
ncbi:TetR family transcriptional regulator C-terminal domain-containing protein [Nocardioides sp. 1609]|uniref:TetR/AcrR family transcriptional regulator n=1 Tax=Nocardioides sp. 1609 TaxID=2508327 RepID=UPI00106F32C1|nr:TetR family transcriptional regulator C-terminal domain-containing protein [Nocardioides sp. 1609]